MLQYNEIVQKNGKTYLIYDDEDSAELDFHNRQMGDSRRNARLCCWDGYYNAIEIDGEYLDS